MTSEEITSVLTQVFGAAVQKIAPDAWQVEENELRLLILLSEDQSWLRALATIAPLEEAEPFFPQLLEANFDQTQDVRYAISQGVVWGVFQHSRASLTSADFERAIARLVSLQQTGLSDSFNKFAEDRIRQIIRVAKLQGQSLETTMQTLDRFYEEGLMGGINQAPQQRSDFLEAWRHQLERLWQDVEPES
jgi:AAA+ ATPase superfamily predicted ATPase